MWKLVFVLVVGNMVVFKLLELMLFFFLKLVLLCEKVGISEGVFNLFMGDGEVGSVLIEYKDVVKVFFIGGLVIGKCIY